MDNYDNWKLASPDETCTCDKCDRKFDSDSKLNETSEGELICNSCSDDYECCANCGVIIVSSDYGHDELCDSCVDRAVDRIESDKGETY